MCVRESLCMHATMRANVLSAGEGVHAGIFAHRCLSARMCMSVYLPSCACVGLPGLASTCMCTYAFL